MAPAIDLLKGFLQPVCFFVTVRIFEPSPNFGEEMFKNFQFMAEFENSCGLAATEQFLDFLIEAGRGAVFESGGLFACGLTGVLLDGEVERGGKADGR